MIASDLIPVGTASMILSMEPLECLRYLKFLSPEGVVITSSNPFKNISDYPPIGEITGNINSLPHSLLVDSDSIARQAGSIRATNMVMVGAASHFLPIKTETIERFIETQFASKGEKVVEINLKAFRSGRQAGEE
jgi:indolepyruvate ferredoxin oxidoreductase beta subunit